MQLYRTQWVMAAALFLAGPVDTVQTLLWWHLEGNPLIIALGPVGLVSVKLASVGGMAVLWSVFGLDEHPVGKACAWFLLVLYTVVTGTNALVVAGVV